MYRAMAHPVYEPVFIAARWQLRVRDLGRDDWLHVDCYGCGRVLLVPSRLLGGLATEHERLVHVVARFSCTLCPRGTPLEWSTYRRRSFEG